MKALGIDAHHVILAIAPDGAGIIRSSLGADGLSEMSAMLKEIAEQAGPPKEYEAWSYRCSGRWRQKSKSEVPAALRISTTYRAASGLRGCMCAH
jgi:hypothetical protein